MKNIKYILAFISAVVFTFAMQSCEDDSTDFEPLTWKETISVEIESSGNNLTFLKTADETWAKETIELSGKLNWDVGDNPVSKIEFYIYCQEEVNDELVLHGEGDGKLLASITDVADGTFSFETSVDEVYELFKNDFKTDRANKLMISDVFELKSVLYGENGEMADQRVDRISPRDIYSLGVDLVDIWSGTFDYVYLSAGPGTLAYNNVYSGYEGTITFEKVGSGTYSIDDTEFDGGWKGIDVRGTMDYDALTGEILISSIDDNVWHFSNFNGPSVELRWTSRYTQWGEWGTVILTRTDGVDWPTNLH